MSLIPILSIPDSALREVCTPVEIIGDDTRALVENMFETMYEAPGIGLAAPQVGVLARIVTIDVAQPEQARSPLAMINPEILVFDDEISTYEEGCLSIPGFYAEVERPKACRVRYLDLDGNEQEMDAEGLLSTCIQHEVDHLNGVLFIDYLSKLKRDRVMAKFKKAARQRAKTATA